MTARDHNRIDLITSGRYEEAVAVGIVSPGMLMEMDSAGKVLAHSVAGGNAEGDERLIAMGDSLQGKNVDQAYAVGDIVPFMIPKSGDVFAILLAAEENITAGDELTSKGDGLFKGGATTDNRMFEALETLDLTGGANTLIRARA